MAPAVNKRKHTSVGAEALEDAEAKEAYAAKCDVPLSESAVLQNLESAGGDDDAKTRNAPRELQALGDNTLGETSETWGRSLVGSLVQVRVVASPND